MRTVINPSSNEEIDSEKKKLCAYCSRPFYTDNLRAIFCSPSCKQKSYQSRKLHEAEIISKVPAPFIANSPLHEDSEDNSNANIESEPSIEDLKEKLRLIESKARISDQEYALLVGVMADKWFSEIMDGMNGEEIVLSLKEICNKLPQLADWLIRDVGECEASEHGFSTANFTLRYILRGNDDAYIPGQQNPINYLLKKQTNA